MSKIDITKKLTGIPDDRIISKEIVDEKIISHPYAWRIINYILDTQGRAWWTVQGQMAATEPLNRFDKVEFFLDGENYEGFLAEHPVSKGSFSHGSATQTWDVTILFLNDEQIVPQEEDGLGHGESPHGELGHGI